MGFIHSLAWNRNGGRWSAIRKKAWTELAIGAGGAEILIEDTATGNPLTFITDISKPLKSLLIPFTPIQSGNGDPSPENIRPILPWNGLTVFGGGKNLFNKYDPDVQLNKRIATGGTIIGSQYSQAVTGFIPVKEGAKYIINSFINENYFSCFYSEKDITKPVGAIFGNNEFPKTAPKGAKYLIVTISNAGIDSFQIEVGTTATAYVPYAPVTETDIVFPSHVYGGTLDVVSGVLTVEYVTVDLGSLSWTYNSDRFYTTGLANVIKRGASARRLVMYCPIFLCISDGRSQANVPDMSMYEGGNGNVFIHDSSYTDKDAFKEAMDGIVLCYPLAEPQTVQLTGEQITALVGNNTIWSDADGQLTAVYLKRKEN